MVGKQCGPDRSHSHAQAAWRGHAQRRRAGRAAAAARQRLARALTAMPRPGTTLGERCAAALHTLRRAFHAGQARAMRRRNLQQAGASAKAVTVKGSACVPRACSLASGSFHTYKWTRMVAALVLHVITPPGLPAAACLHAPERFIGACRPLQHRDAWSSIASTSLWTRRRQVAPAVADLERCCYLSAACAADFVAAGGAAALVQHIRACGRSSQQQARRADPAHALPDARRDGLQCASLPETGARAPRARSCDPGACCRQAPYMAAAPRP